MKKVTLIASLIAGCAFLAYDFWLFTTGQFQPLTILAIGAWLALLLWIVARAGRRSGRVLQAPESGDGKAEQAKP